MRPYGGGLAVIPGAGEAVVVRTAEGVTQSIATFWDVPGLTPAEEAARWFVGRLRHMETEDRLLARVDALEETVRRLESEVDELRSREDHFLGELLDERHGRGRLEGEP